MRQIFVFVGPYAEWLVPPDGRFWPGRPDEAWDRLLDGGLLAWAISEGEGVPQVQVDGQTVSRLCAVPRQERVGKPDRPMLLMWNAMGPIGGGEPLQAICDCTTLDRQAEIAWYRYAFAPELTEIARLSGIEPTLRWGLLYWYQL